MQRNINLLLDNIRKIVERHRVEVGGYSLRTFADSPEKDRSINAYGCADAANILYSLGDFPRDVAERAEWIRTLQSMQNPETGIIDEGSHHYMHCTAHCLAALELFDAGPLYPLLGFEPYRTKEGLYRFLEEIEWARNPWIGSHRGAGIFAAMNLAGEATPEWNDWYFRWFWEEADPETGLWRREHIPSRYRCMGSSFHYLFNHQHCRMPLRYPEKLIDTCLELFYGKEMGETFGKQIGFAEIDWVYCITRALRQCGHRFAECKAAIGEFADAYLAYLMSLDPDTDPDLDNIHRLFGSVCCIAELQNFLPGQILSDKPLKLVLDRRPFI